MRSYYASVRFQVELPSGLTAAASAELGVKQGCPLSPVLFGVFIEGLLRDFTETARADPAMSLVSLGAGTVTDTVDPVLFADDLSMVASSLAGLQRQAALLSRLAAKYGLSINVGKTKAMAIGAKLRDGEALTPIELDGQPVDWVSKFRYLGLDLHAHLGLSHAGDTLLAAATTRYHAVWRRCRELGIEDVGSLGSLFDSLVSTVLGYGVALWGPEVFYNEGLGAETGKSNSLASRIERLQKRFERALLGVPQLTPSLLLSIETNRPPLQVGFLRFALRYLRRLSVHLQRGADSLLGLALRANVTLAQHGLPCWLSRLHSWCNKVKAPFDLNRLVEQAGLIDRRSKRIALDVLDPASDATADDGAARALSTWTAAVNANFPAHGSIGAPRSRQRRSATSSVLYGTCNASLSQPIPRRGADALPQSTAILHVCASGP